MSNSIRKSYSSYIPEEEDVENSSKTKSSTTKGSLAIALLFLLSGCPNSFNVTDTLWCELSWSEISQPEGYALASWFLLIQSLVTPVVLCMLYIEIYVMIFPKIGLLYGFSLGTVLISGVLSFTWHVSVDGWSIFQWLAMFAGVLTGWVQMIFVLPWITENWNPRIISPFLSGDTLMVFILTSLDLIQEPGGAKYFSPTVYYIVVFTIYCITFGICIYTFHNGIERLTSKDAVQALEPWRSSLWTQTFTPVFWDTKLLTFGWIWVIQLSFAVVPAALPYAAKNTTNSDANKGENFLQWAIAIGYLMEFFGSVLSFIPSGNYRIGESMALNTIANGIIILAANSIGVWTSWGMKVLLMGSVVLSRVSYGWMMPLIPRELARRFPDKTELVVRSNSLWVLYSNIVVRVPLLLLTSGVIQSKFM